MAKVTGPAFSLGASKSLKKTLTFQKRPSGHAVYPYKKPGDREPVSPSDKQLLQRSVIAALVAQWQTLGSITKGVWNNYAKYVRFIGTGYHYFISKGGAMPSLTDVRIFFGNYIARVTSQGWLEVKTHTPDKCLHQDYAAAQTDQEIITPAAGKKLRIIQVYVSTEDETVDVTLKFETSGNIVFKLYTGKKQAQTGNVICGTGAVDEGLELTCGDGTFVSVGYDEID